MATAGDTLAENLAEILRLAGLDAVVAPDDVITPENRTKMFGLLTYVLALTYVLDNLEKPTLNLLSKDFREILVERIKFIRERFVDQNGEPLWQDFRETNLGTVLLELNSGEDEKFYFIVDRVFTESILDFVSDRFFLGLKAKEYDYKFRGNEAASVILTFVLSVPKLLDVVIPQDTQVATATGDTTFFTVDELRIPAGGVRGSISAINGAPVPQTITTNGAPKQIFILTSSPVIPSSVVVAPSGGLPWDSRDSLFRSRSDSTHYVIRLEPNQSSSVLFGDGKNGQIPTGIFSINYRTGGGSAANDLQRNTITELLTQVSDSLGGTIASSDIQVFNNESPVGGVDIETIAEAKRNIKIHNRSLERSITLSDFEDNAVTIPGVQRAFAIDRPFSLREELDVIIGGDDVQLLIVPDTPDELSAELTTIIQQAFVSDFPPISTAIVIPTLALFEVIDIEGQVTFAVNSNFSLAMFSIRQALEEFFSFSRKDNDGTFTIDWGFRKNKFSKSKIISVIEGFTDLGVVGVNLTVPLFDVPIDKIKIPRLGATDNLIAIDTEGNVLT